MSNRERFVIRMAPLNRQDALHTLYREDDPNTPLADVLISEEADKLALLLSTAPALLKEVEAIYAELADVHNDWPGRDTPKGQTKLSRLRDLIADATGEHPRDVQDTFSTATTITTCPWCGMRGPDFDESPMPSDVCHHDPAGVADGGGPPPATHYGYLQHGRGTAGPFRTEFVQTRSADKKHWRVLWEGAWRRVYVDENGPFIRSPESERIVFQPAPGMEVL